MINIRTQDQIQRKLNELKQVKQLLTTLQTQKELEIVEHQIAILEWVLDQPMENYHG